MIEKIPEFISLIVERIFSYWWVGALIVLFLIGKRLYEGAFKYFHDYWEDRFLERIERVALEVRIPTDLEKTPHAMEQVYAGLYGTARSPSWWDVKFRGYLETTYTFELISRGGNIHFVLNVPREYQEVVESHLYSQFAEIEINEIKDYTKDAPDVLPNEDYGIAACEFQLEKDDPYPIRTYKDFDIEPGRRAEEAVDPIASTLETFNNVRPDCELWLQVLFAPPMGGDWRAEGRAIIDEMMGRGSGFSSEGLFRKFFGEVFDLLKLLFAELASFITGERMEVSLRGGNGEEEEDDDYPMWKLTPGEQDAIEAIERNISKPGFFSVVRAVYFAPWEKFTTDRLVSIIGSYQQFSEGNLNSFETNSALGYKVRLKDFWEYRKEIYFMAWKYKEIPTTPEQLREMRMREIYHNYKVRSPGKPARGHSFLTLNTEELATIYHFPMKSVETPELPQQEAQKGEPPSSLPT